MTKSDVVVGLDAELEIDMDVEDEFEELPVVDEQTYPRVRFVSFSVNEKSMAVDLPFHGRNLSHILKEGYYHVVASNQFKETIAGEMVYTYLLTLERGF
jgi:hypothetical protein